MCIKAQAHHYGKFIDVWNGTQKTEGGDTEGQIAIASFIFLSSGKYESILVHMRDCITTFIFMQGLRLS